MSSSRAPSQGPPSFHEDSSFLCRASCSRAAGGLGCHGSGCYGNQCNGLLHRHDHRSVVSDGPSCEQMESCPVEEMVISGCVGQHK